ncbi:unnamed protein product [Urochloa decumbens]|uniref:G-patch domain-containing protein n=1 Tax=Urochloa decumbens TaxID=240449 RepID=A0ABC8XNZ7_9POAL
MEDEKKRLSFSIACKRRPTNPPSAPAAADDVPNPNSNSAPTGLQFEEPALAAACRAFVLDTSTAPDSGDPSSDTPYGLTLRNAADMEEEPPKISPQEFSAALLAGYGWSKGQCVGKSHRNRKEADAKASSQYGDRQLAGKPAFGYNPSEHGPRKSRSGEWIFSATKVTAGNGTAKKRGRDARDTTEEDKNCNASRHKISEKRSRTEDCDKLQWLHSHIRVRVVSKKLGKRLYLMKGKVVDVVSPTACDVVMEDGSEVVQGVGQDMLETVLPRTNGMVLVLYGTHKGVCGRLVEKNSEEETGLVEDADTKAVVRVRYGQMAEYTGDLELPGY